MKDNNQPDAEFDMEMFKWKDNVGAVFISRCNIEECKNKLYLMFTDQ